MFNTSAKAYIKSLCSIRSRLLKTHSNHRSETHLASIVCELNRYLNAYDYNNWQMAGFWINHKTQIAELIPGEGSKTHKTLVEKFKELDKKAVFITECKMKNVECTM